MNAVTGFCLRHRRLVVLAWLLLAAILLPAPAFADASGAGGDVVVAQSLGTRELTVTLRRITSIPGPLHVDVISHAGTAPGTLRLTVTPTGADQPGLGRPVAGVATGAASVTLTGAPGSTSAALAVDRAGPWELSIDDGVQVARIPFVAHGQATSPPERFVYGGFLAAGVFLLVAFVFAAARAWLLVLAGTGIVAGVAVAVAGALLSAALPLPAQPGTQVDATVQNGSDPYASSLKISDYSRPAAMLLLPQTTLPVALATTVNLQLADAATGRPVDDLVVHDSALMHLMIIGPNGQLWHRHPIRTAPGRFAFLFTAPGPGHYAVTTELERLGGGVQMLRSGTGFDATGSGTAAPESPLTPNQNRVIDGTPVQVVLPSATAGQPATLLARAGSTSDLQPWLGMLGHLIVVGPLPNGTALGSAAQGAPVWSHGHAMGSQRIMSGGGSMAGMTMEPMVPMVGANGASLPDETVEAYGPTVGFTFVFPLPGVYRAWIQVERHYRVLTVPVLITVAAK